MSEREFEVIGTLTDDCRYIEISNYQPLKRIIRNLKGEQLLVKFKKFFETRSDKQNRYIWGVVVPTVMAWMRETTGEKPVKDDVYVWLRKSLLGHTLVVSEILGEEVVRLGGKRFSKMTTKEFAEAIEIIIDTMAQRGCIIPLPRRNNLLTDFIDE